MRVVSLLPAATEIACAVGGESMLVGISHECDWPASIRNLPRLTSTPIDPRRSSREIDDAVRALRAEGRPVIVVDADRLREARPDLILTQDLCEVCAVADGQLHRLAEVLDPTPSLLPLRGRTVDGICEDIVRVARALDLAPEATEVVAGMRYRLRRLAATARDAKPRVVCIEWLDPLFLAGHWVPELVAAAGGEDVGARPGDHSRIIEREALAALEPDVILVMLCGFTAERATDELARTPLPDLGVPVRVLDGNSHTSRPGPRVVEGAEAIARALRG